VRVLVHVIAVQCVTVIKYGEKHAQQNQPNKEEIFSGKKVFHSFQHKTFITTMTTTRPWENTNKQ